MRFGLLLGHQLPRPWGLGVGAQSPADGLDLVVRTGRLRRTVHAQSQAAFRSWVKRSDDRLLERTAGSPQGLRILFAAMQSAFLPAEAGGFTGELAYELRGRDGGVRSWTVTLGPDRARARPGPAIAPQLTVKLAVADFVRIAGRDLDAGTALLTGRMDLEGDFSLAARLGAMFGQSGL